MLRDFWKDFSAAVGETKDLKISHVIDELDEMLGPHIFPPDADGTDPRKCPDLRHGRAEPEARPLRRLRRLLELSGMPLHPPARRKARAKRRCRPARTGPRSRQPANKITLRTGRFGPYVQLGEGEKPKRAGIPKGTDADERRSGDWR